MQNSQLGLDSDVIKQIVARLDNSTIEALAHTSAWPLLVQYGTDPHFWFERVEYLLQHPLRWRPGDWEHVYTVLLDVIDRSWNRRLGPSAYHDLEVLEDPLALDVVLDVLPVASSQYMFSAAILCVEQDYANSLQLLLDRANVDPSQYRNQLIRRAAIYGRPEVTAVLLADDRVDPSAENDAAIIKAVVGTYANPENYDLKNGEPPTAEDYLEVVRLLLTDGRVDPSVNGNWLIESAEERADQRMVDLLLTDARVRQ